MNCQIEDIILNNIITLEKLQKKDRKGNRNILNKWFQDSIKACFMEKFAGTLLLKPLNKRSVLEIKTLIHMDLSNKHPIYISIILRYFEIICLHHLEKEFSRNLIQDMYKMEECISTDFVSDYKTEKQIRSCFVSYLIYNYFKFFLCKNDILKINTFFQIWSLSFPEQEIKQRRRNSCQMYLLKNQQSQKIFEFEELTNSCDTNNEIPNSMVDNQGTQQQTRQIMPATEQNDVFENNYFNLCDRYDDAKNYLQEHQYQQNASEENKDSLIQSIDLKYKPIQLNIYQQQYSQSFIS